MRMGGRGLIVERSGRKVTVLRRDGDLVMFNTDRDDIMVGMEIEVPVKPVFFTWKRLAPAVALSLVIVLVSTFGYQHYLHAQPVVAYVTLDSTGSIELEVNQAGIVKSARALDAAGEKALAAVQYQNRPAGEVVQELIKAQDPENKTGVVVALVPVADPEPAGKGAKKTEKAIDRIEEKVTGGSSSSATNVTSLRLDPEIRNSAQELGISAGRAALWALTQPPPKPDPGSDPEPVQDPGSAQPGTEPTADPGQATVPVGPGQTTGPDDPAGRITTHPGDPPGAKADPGGQPDKSPQKDILEMIKKSLPKVDLDEWPGLNSNKKNSKESQELLKDITKKWLQEISKQVGKQDKDDDDDRRDDDKKGSPGQSKDDDDKKNPAGGPKGNDDKKNPPGEPKGNDDKKNPPGGPKGNDDKGSQGKGNTSAGSSAGKGSSSGAQGKNDDDHGRRDDDQGKKESQSKGSSSTNKSNYWSDLLNNLFNRLQLRRK